MELFGGLFFGIVIGALTLLGFILIVISLILFSMNENMLAVGFIGVGVTLFVLAYLFSIVEVDLRKEESERELTPYGTYVTDNKDSIIEIHEKGLIVVYDKSGIGRKFAYSIVDEDTLKYNQDGVDIVVDVVSEDDSNEHSLIVTSSDGLQNKYN